MTDPTATAVPEPDDGDPGEDSEARAASGSRRWRSLWRLHFYAGIVSAPFIVLMALTGLVILYTQPIHDLTEGDVRTVSDAGEWTSFDTQAQAVADAYPDNPVVSMTMPQDAEHSTIFGLDSGREVYVDPYTAEVLGDGDPGGGIVGFANRLHGVFNNDRRMISLPTVSALWDDGPVMRDYVIGDLILEILGVWVMVLALSGLYLWWPRRSRANSSERTGRSLFGIRMGKKGRARWRDLHAVPGVVMACILLVTLVSGMAWSTYWGANFSSLAEKATPSEWTGDPVSSLGTRADLDQLDRVGNQIHWMTGDIPVPASYGLPDDGSVPAPISLDTVVAIGELEGMKPGYYVYFPDNSQVDDVGNPIYGTFVLSNSWPRKTGEARDVFIDEFTGEHVDEMDGWGYGSIQYGMDVLVSWHMGTQWGIVTRIFMTLLCVLSIWSVISALVMYWKRRRPGTLGLPRRPVSVTMSKRLTVALVALAIVFPQWGVTALIVLAVDKFVIRKVPRLRAAFGQR